MQAKCPLPLMPIFDAERIFYAEDVPSPDLDNESFAYLFVKLIREIYGGHENLPILSKVRYFSRNIDPTSPFTTITLNPRRWSIGGAQEDSCTFKVILVAEASRRSICFRDGDTIL